jgi:CHAT domain-containing protein
MPPTAGNIEHYLREIHRILIEPIEAYICNKKVILLLDGRFMQIPFGELRDQCGKIVKDTYNFSIILDPNIILKKIRSKTDFGSKRNAVFTTASDYLPSVAKEGRSIKSSFKAANLYSGINSTTNNLHEELKLANGFVHIAAHASRSHENPLFSQILTNNGPFFPFDMFNIKIDAELITLSGCQTAAPGLYYGDSYSLAGVFSQAGARYVLASLWTVSDDISMIFMKEFYKILKEYNDIQFAYTGALNKLYNTTVNPAHRGAFILIGV